MKCLKCLNDAPESFYPECDHCKAKREAQNAKKAAARRKRRATLKAVADSLGMTVVRGALGGIYIE